MVRDRRRTREKCEAGKHEEDGIDASEHGAWERKGVEGCRERVGCGSEVEVRRQVRTFATPLYLAEQDAGGFPFVIGEAICRKFESKKSKGSPPISLEWHLSPASAPGRGDLSMPYVKLAGLIHT